MSFKDMIASVYCNSSKQCWGTNGLTWLIETTWRVRWDEDKVMWHVNLLHSGTLVVPVSPESHQPLTWGSSQRAMIFPTSWIRPTNWNQSVQRQWTMIWFTEWFSMSSAAALLANATFVRVCLADALSSLEGVEGVGEVDVGIGFIYQLV